MRFIIRILILLLLISVSTGCGINFMEENETPTPTSEIQYINELFYLDLSDDCHVQDKIERYQDDHSGAFFAKVVVTKDVFEKFSTENYEDVDDFTLDDARYVLSKFETDEDIENLKIHKLYKRWDCEIVGDMKYRNTKLLIFTANDSSYCIYFFATIHK